MNALLQRSPDSGVRTEVSGTALNTALEEYKLIDQQARFVMTSYMQMLALYFVVVGVGLKEILAATTNLRTVALGLALTGGNILAIYAAYHFKKMAYHALDRQSILAEQLGFQPPYGMKWGYYGGIGTFIIVEAGFAAVVGRLMGWI